MKKCTYCGKEYPDETTICAVDGQTLASTEPQVAEEKTSDDRSQESSQLIAIGILIGFVVLPLLLLRGHGVYTTLDTAHGDFYQILSAPVPPIVVSCLSALGGFVAALLAWPRFRFSLPCFSGALGTFLYGLTQPLQASECILKLDLFSGICGKRGSTILFTPLGFAVLLVVLGCLLLMSLPKGPAEYVAESPDGLQRKATVDQLRADFVSGKITAEWVVRGQDGSTSTPITELLYPPK